MNKLKLALCLLCLLCLCKISFAGDSHQDDSTHAVVYTVVDDQGNHVSGQTIRLTMYNPKTNKYYDFADGAWENLSTVSSLHRSMTENATNWTYFTTVTVDSSTLVSADVVMTVSNDDASYGDMQSESVNFDRLEDMIRINR